MGGDNLEIHAELDADAHALVTTAGAGRFYRSTGESARQLAAQMPHCALLAGVSAPQPQVIVLRVLGQRTEPIIALLRAVWAQWRCQAWALPACAPRVWAT